MVGDCGLSVHTTWRYVMNGFIVVLGVLAAICHIGAGILYLTEGNTETFVWVCIASVYAVQVWIQRLRDV